jgi:hypothetical protein
MAENKPIPESGFNLRSISGILNIIIKAFVIPEPPLTPLPPPLIMSGANLRTGLSPQGIASDIISKQSNAGRVVGDVFADGPNVEEAMEVIRVQQIINAILTDAKIEIVVPPGVSVSTTGIGNLGAPVISQGTTTSMGIGNGIVR